MNKFYKTFLAIALPVTYISLVEEFGKSYYLYEKILFSKMGKKYCGYNIKEMIK
jgi:hypothetical protein